MQRCLPWITSAVAVLVTLEAGKTTAGLLAPVRVLTVPLPGLLDVTGNAYTGFIPEMLNAISNRSTLTFQYVTPLGTDFGRNVTTGLFNGIAGQLLAGDGDMIAAAMENDTSYKNAFSLTTPLYISHVQRIFPVTIGNVSNLAVADPAAMARLQKHVPYTVVLENTATRAFLEQSLVEDMKLVWKDWTIAQINAIIPHSYSAAVQCVQAAYCKFIGRTPAIDNAVANSGGQIKKHPKILRTVSAHFAVKKGNLALLNQLNAAITILHKTGDIKKIFERYFPNTPFEMPKLV